MIKVEAKHRRIEASLFDGIFKDLGHFMANGITSRLEQGAQDVFRWMMGRLALQLVGFGVVVVGVIFLLVAGIEGLKAASVPPAVAHLIAGVTGLATGLLLLRLKK